MISTHYIDGSPYKQPLRTLVKWIKRTVTDKQLEITNTSRNEEVSKKVEI